MTAARATGNGTSNLLSRGPAALTVISYVAAIAVLTWATVNGHLGDHLYGWIVMTVLAFPASLLNMLLDGLLTHALIGEPSRDEISIWNYAIFAWPGLLMAIVMAWSLASNHLRRLARIASWVLTAAVILFGIVITLDQWAPRRPFGWPLVLCGVGMAIGLLLIRRADARGGRPPTATESAPG